MQIQRNIIIIMLTLVDFINQERNLCEIIMLQYLY